MSAPISEAKCEAMTACRKRGDSLEDIAEIYDVHRSTVYVHVTDRCNHTYSEISEATITVAIVRLADHLGRIPTEADWLHWDDAPCGSGKVRQVCGNWTTAVEKAGLTPVPQNVPDAVRTAVYQEATH